MTALREDRHDRIAARSLRLPNLVCLCDREFLQARPKASIPANGNESQGRRIRP